ncbi:transcriptional regulator [Haloferula helveola]|uniref:Transcriptional regulator n=1 Tax=Haloferula helveola TaxID=490095 RepID=A0ABM7R888_9BACT|nr:transcriptional regulator [Haloferula helveola]
MKLVDQKALRTLYDGDEALREVFDVLPVCHFSAKDYRGIEEGEAGPFLTANRRFLADKGLSEVAQIRGRTDFEFYPEELVHQYLAEDWRVFRMGQPLVSQPWLVVEPTGQALIWTSSKFPVFDGDDRPMGIVCVMYPAKEDDGGYIGSGRLTDVLVHIQSNLDQPLRHAELASMIGLSGSQLSRLFRASFGESVGQYIKRVRLHAAASRLLTTESSIAEIAAHFSYYDPSHFTREFHRFHGMSPRDYRRMRSK